MSPDDLPFTAEDAARQRAILAAEIAIGWTEPPPEVWQLADLDDGPPDWLEGALSPEGEPAAAADGPGWAEPVPFGIVAHEPAGPGGTGFASGSVLDRLDPGPVLTGSLDDVHDAGLGGMSDDELAGVILACRRSESHAVADLLAAVGELHRRRMTHSDPHVGEHAADELAILLTLTSWAANGLMDQAAMLRRLPATLAALRAGRIDRNKAAVIIHETSLLDDALAGAVEQLIIEDAPGQTTSRLRARLRHAVQAADPTAVRRRKEKAAKEARVELQSEMSGNAQLSGRELPPAAAIAADARIDAAARALKASGVKARLTQLRAAVLLGLLTGSDPLRFLPSTDPGEPDGAAAGTTADQAEEPPVPAEEPADPAEEPTDPAGALPVSGSVHLTVPLTTWLELTDSPGELPGYGVADADTSREMAQHIAATRTSRWCLTITDRTGRAIAHACARRPPPGSSEERAGWLGKMKITRIEAGTCTHAREVPGYRIPASLHHIVQTRQRTCSAPGCRRHATRCDTDHTLAYDRGGRTCECSLSPLCRKHHRAKQAEGWYLEQPEPGVLVWRLPHDRRYVVTPGVYPI